jgi:hypothetical protein
MLATHPFLRPSKNLLLWLIALTGAYLITAIYAIWLIAGFDFALHGIGISGPAFALPLPELALEVPLVGLTSDGDCQAYTVVVICFDRFIQNGWPLIMTTALTLVFYATISGRAVARWASQPTYEDSGIGSRTLWLLPLLFPRNDVSATFQPLVSEAQERYRAASDPFRRSLISGFLFVDILLHALALAVLIGTRILHGQR